MKKLTGFTLIELMIVIAIVGILASIILPMLGINVETCKDGEMECNIVNTQSGNGNNIITD